MTTAVPLPDELPPGYEWFEDEPTFDAERDLALTEPDEVVLLSDLGYPSEEIATKATTVAASAPFRVLSTEGATTLLAVARRLRSFHRPAGDRIERMTRGGCYRSRWLRDLCLSPEVTEHLGRIYGTEVAPHPMAVHLGHLNYEPTHVGAAVDKWHHDTLPLDYVMMVTDPADLRGGRFEYFVGTRHEAAELAAADEQPSPARRVAPHFGGAGWAIALHGDMVVHRAAPLTAPAERITMVNGYVSIDATTDEQSRSRDLITIDDPNTLYTEWAKFAAWRSQRRLSDLIARSGFISDPTMVADQLETAIADVQRAAADMRAGTKDLEHYGG